MLAKSTIQDYINNFRRRLAPILKPGMGLRCLVHLAESGGAILEFTVGSDIENDDTYKEPLPSIGKALAGIEQRAFGGNLEGFSFGETNYILESNRIILIKDESLLQWDDAAAERDIQKLFFRNPRRAK